MSAAFLLADLERLGIRLEVNGDRLRYYPRSAATPALMDRLKAHKREILYVLRADEVAHGRHVDHPYSDWIESNEPNGDLSWTNPDCPPRNLTIVDPPDSCPECGTLELWETFGGDWRCIKCSPPVKSRELAKKASELRRLARVLSRRRTKSGRIRSRLTLGCPTQPFEDGPEPAKQ